jgi:hypothetical protein
VDISGIQLASWNFARRAFRQSLRPSRELRDCGHDSGIWRRLRGRHEKILLRGSRYCVDQCLDKVLADIIQQLRFAGRSATSTVHRIPLGLLLLSRQQITAEGLRVAIEAQRFAGHGKIGEWLQTLGFVTEYQVTAALARQWACPVRRTLPLTHGLNRNPQIPAFLLHSSVMIPIEYVESTATLHVAFGEGIDRGVLYAIEQMLDCRTEPCLVVPSLLHKSLQTSFEHRGPSEVVFDRIADVSEGVRIIRSYCTRVAAVEIRIVPCGLCLWIRLIGAAKRPLDLLFHAGGDASLDRFGSVACSKVSHPPADRN